VNELPRFEGLPVATAAVRITRAGDGLSEALKIAPKALELGDEVYYVLRGVVRQINHREKSDGDIIVRIHTVEADAITEVDAELAGKLLADAASEIAKAKAAADGQDEIGFDDDAGDDDQGDDAGD
jgi:hypothetical protein